VPRHWPEHWTGGGIRLILQRQYSILFFSIAHQAPTNTSNGLYGPRQSQISLRFAFSPVSSTRAALGVTGAPLFL